MFNPLSYKHLPPAKSIKTHRALPPISQWVVGGGWFMAIALTASASLTTLIKYKTVVRAPMVVRPQGELKLVQSAVAGSVVSIDVTINETVRAGQTIAILDSSQLKTQQQQLQDSITEAQNQIEQIDAQAALISNQMATENSRIETTISMAKTELASSQRQYSDQQVTTLAQLREAEAALQLAQSELSSYQQLVAQGAVAPLEVTQKQATVETASARLDSLAPKLNPDGSDVIIAQEKISQAQSQGAVAISQLMQAQSQLIQQRSEIQKTLNNSIQERQQTAKDLENIEIKASTNGTIQALSLRNPDQVVQPGETIAKIFPDGAMLEVQAAVPAKEIAKVDIGQSVNMRISSCPFSKFGTLSGVVRTVSPDVISDVKGEATSQDGFYSVAIQPESLQLQTKSRTQESGCPIRAGLEGRADIIAREETVFDFIRRKASLVVGS